MNKSKIAMIAAITVLSTAGLMTPAQNTVGTISNPTAITAYAADSVYNGNGYQLNYTVSGNSATVTGFKKTSTAATVKVSIPAKLGGKNVTKIGRYAFHSAAISECTMPDTVTALGEYAFTNCQNLTTITLSKNLSVAASDGYLFTGCNKLKTINVSGNMSDSSFLTTHIWVLNNCTVQGAYSGNGYQLNYKILDANNAANGAEILSFAKTSSAVSVKVDIPEKINGYDVKKIGVSAFKRAAVSEISMPDTVTTLATYVFNDNSYLTKIKLSKRLVDSTATGYLFNGCNNLKTVVASSEMDPAFYRHLDYNWITDLTYQIIYNDSYALDYKIIDNAVTVKKFHKISSADAVKVTIPTTFRGKDITTIGDHAFCDAAASEVVMSDNITTIQSWAFNNAKAMKKIVLSRNLIWNAAGDLFHGVEDTLEQIVVPPSENAKLFALSHMNDIKCLWPYIKQVTDPAAQNVYNSMKNAARITNPEINWNIPASGWAREEAKYQIAHYIHTHFCDYVTYDGSKPALGTSYCLSTGYGVCGTMARSYLLLLKTAGFHDDEMELIGAPGHELTGIKLFNEWYFVECTNSDEDSFAMRYQNEWYTGTAPGSYDGFVNRLPNYEEYYYYTGGAVTFDGNANSEAALAERYKAVYPRGDVNHDGVFNNADRTMMDQYRAGANVQPNLVMSYVRKQLNTNTPSYWL